MYFHILLLYFPKEWWGFFFLKNYVYQFHEKTRSIRTYYYIIFLLVYAFFMMRNFSKTSKKSVGEKERVVDLI